MCLNEENWWVVQQLLKKLFQDINFPGNLAHHIVDITSDETMYNKKHLKDEQTLFNFAFD